MVNPNKELPLWNDSAAGMWQQYLESKIGSAGLERLAALRPSISGTTLEQVGLTGALVKGYEQCLANIMALTISDNANKAPEVSDAFPPIDDDSKWEDGEQKPQ